MLETQWIISAPESSTSVFCPLPPARLAIDQWPEGGGGGKHKQTRAARCCCPVTKGENTPTKLRRRSCAECELDPLARRRREHTHAPKSYQMKRNECLFSFSSGGQLATYGGGGSGSVGPARMTFSTSSRRSSCASDNDSKLLAPGDDDEFLLGSGRNGIWIARTGNSPQL